MHKRPDARGLTAMKRFNKTRNNDRLPGAISRVQEGFKTKHSFFLLSCVIFVHASNILAADRPNILFAIADDWGTDHAGVYGCDWIKTPSFDRLAKEGILFRRAYTPNAKCAPCRAIILTGRNSWQLEDACNHINYFPAKTCAATVGVELAADAGPDSRDLLPLFEGNDKPVRPTLIGAAVARLNRYIRRGPWKLIFRIDDATGEISARELYRLETDQTENIDLANRRPEVVKQLVAEYRSQHAAGVSP